MGSCPSKGEVLAMRSESDPDCRYDYDPKGMEKCPDMRDPF